MTQLVRCHPFPELVLLRSAWGLIPAADRVCSQPLELRADYLCMLPALLQHLHKGTQIRGAADLSSHVQQRIRRLGESPQVT